MSMSNADGPGAERTVSDWLRRAEGAEQAGDPAEAGRCLDAAESLASSCFDLRQVLEGARELRAAGDARVAALADRLLGVAQDEGDLLSFGAVARARFSRLGDPAGARAALEAGCRALAARETRGYE